MQYAYLVFSSPDSSPAAAASDEGGGGGGGGGGGADWLSAAALQRGVSPVEAEGIFVDDAYAKRDQVYTKESRDSFSMTFYFF